MKQFSESRPMAFTVLAATLVGGFGGMSTLAAWPMKHADMQHTGRSSFVVPPERQNDSFFDILRWQKPTPGNGGVSSGSLVYYDGAGPGGADLLVGGYHWPKGVLGLDRHTGARLWFGNPSGGETIGASTPAFSPDGSTIYVVNDATSSGQFPNGHPLMAFTAVSGPAVFWHNGADPQPSNLSMHSATIAPDGRIFLHSWVDRPYAGTDFGNAISRTWAASTSTASGLSDPTLHLDDQGLLVVSGARFGAVIAHDGITGAELWRTTTPTIDATVTIDPATGNIYAPAGSGSISVVGLTRDGQPLWGGVSSALVFQPVGDDEPQRAQAAGCLSHDGGTFYFQTNAPLGTGALYAIHTADGSVKWVFTTGSRGWEMVSSSPIVTPNGIVVVGNNNGGTYYAIRDDGTFPTLLDVLPVVGGGSARATAVLSDDGLLYLPAQLPWTTTNGDGDGPTFAAQNLFNAFDLNADAAAVLAPPAFVQAVALNTGARVTWKPLPQPGAVFGYYAIYRDTQPFHSVAGRTPVGFVTDAAGGVFVDAGLVNGVAYYYAVTTVTTTGGEVENVTAVGPRVPRDETDLQIMALARTPRYPRYCPTYTYYSVTEPSGYGPYIYSAATGLGCGQNINTQRWPHLGDPVTYTAHVRNRGTNAWAGTLTGAWKVDGIPAGVSNLPVVLQPGDVAQLTFNLVWDDEDHEIRCTLEVVDARPENNARSLWTRSAPFLTYVDVGALEDFRDVTTPQWPLAVTDDLVDWLWRHADEMNAMFEQGGSRKRVHYDLLEVVPDSAIDPAEPATIHFGIFPFRYYAATIGDPRSPGYYHANVDIDYGLCHELSHQLGLIDIYQLNVPPEANWVSGQGYSAVSCLMNGVSPFYSAHSALAMDHWAEIVHGYYGQYLYQLPQEIRIRVLDVQGQPVPGATVSMYQYSEVPGQGKVIRDVPKAVGTTDAQGVWALPNVPISSSGPVPTTVYGDTLPDNPFGWVAVVGTNGVLHFKVQWEGFVDYAWLDITEVNVRYWQGETGVQTIDRQLSIGGGLQLYPPADLAEQNAENWSFYVQGGNGSVTDDFNRRIVGASSLRFVTDGGFDNYVRYPQGLLARWNLSAVTHLRFWAYAENPNFSFQNQSPWVRLGNFEDGFFQWTPSSELLNQANNQWREFIVPIAGGSGWTRTTSGTPNLAEINYFQLHADTWGFGFTLWLDGVRFEPYPAPPVCPGDLNCDTVVDFADISPFIAAIKAGPTVPGQWPWPCPWLNGDMNGDARVDFADISGFIAQLKNPPPPCGG